jgi:predicted AlkP superfamily pyrophosphatase or phosphodiesterase
MVWNKLRPEADYVRSGIDDSPYERPEIKKRVFPYIVNGGDTKPSTAFYEQLWLSPFGNDLLLAFAKAAIEGEHLGDRGVTDLLTISFSCNDTIGHNFGPYSHEVEDITLRTDIVLQDLFHYLDAKFGRDGYVVALTADHGAAPSPEQAQQLGLGGGRYDDDEVSQAISEALEKRFGADHWLVASVDQNIYLDHATAARHNLKVSDLSRAAADAALTLPAFAYAFTEADLKDASSSTDLLLQRVAHNYFPGRTGDVLLVQKPYYVSAEVTTGHGSPYAYDSNVPVILWGPYFSSGRYLSPASPADIAPTLASVLHITRPSGAIGRVLTEALRRAPAAIAH